jgi:hypothetical protein
MLICANIPDFQKTMEKHQLIAEENLDIARKRLKTRVPPSVQSGSRSARSAPRTIEAFGESQADDAFTSTLPTSQGNLANKPEQPNDKANEHDFRDSETVYSLESAPCEERYVTAFACRLLSDLKNKKGLKDPSSLPSAFITQTLRLFARRLCEESTDPFQWGTSVVLHRERK